jgi:hypothetical protein
MLADEDFEDELGHETTLDDVVHALEHRICAQRHPAHAR